jgi:hypothetical protein
MSVGTVRFSDVKYCEGWLSKNGECEPREVQQQLTSMLRAAATDNSRVAILGSSQMSQDLKRTAQQEIDLIGRQQRRQISLVFS